jgi:hypothetical protein
MRCQEHLSSTESNFAKVHPTSKRACNSYMACLAKRKKSLRPYEGRRLPELFFKPKNGVKRVVKKGTQFSHQRDLLSGPVLAEKEKTLLTGGKFPNVQGMSSLGPGSKFPGLSWTF